MKIFISYRRKSSSFTLLLANKLSEQLDAEIFVDFESIDEADFETSIMKHLISSDVFLLMVTEHTFAERIHRDSDWVRKEIRTALERKIPIVLVCENGLFPPHDVPNDIREIRGKQGIEFYPAYFDAAVTRLVKFLGKSVNVQRKDMTITEKPLPVPQAEIEVVDIQQEEINEYNARQILGDALVAYDADDFAQALFLLEALRDINYQSRFNIEELIEEINNAYEREESKRTAEYEYEEIAILAKRKRTLKYALSAFKQWSAEYSEFANDLDTENLRSKSAETNKTKKAKLSIPDLMPQPFEWVEILGSQGTMTTNERSVTLSIPTETYWMSKYPITNEQFAKFIEADGYKNKNGG